MKATTSSLSIPRYQATWKCFDNKWGIYLSRVSDDVYNALILGFEGDGFENSDVIFENPICDISITVKNGAELDSLIDRVSRLPNYRKPNLEAKRTITNTKNKPQSYFLPFH
jgi:hypothetical protein